MSDELGEVVDFGKGEFFRRGVYYEGSTAAAKAQKAAEELAKVKQAEYMDHKGKWQEEDAAKDKRKRMTGYSYTP